MAMAMLSETPKLRILGTRRSLATSGGRT